MVPHILDSDLMLHHQPALQLQTQDDEFIGQSNCAVIEEHMMIRAEAEQI
jgi:hypothetical protein